MIISVNKKKPRQISYSASTHETASARAINSQMTRLGRERFSGVGNRFLLVRDSSNRISSVS